MSAFYSDESASSYLGQVPNFKNPERIGDLGMHMYGSFGVHGVASLCGGRVRQISTTGC